jgi:adenosylcobinamide-phosphate synthase
MLTAVIAAAWGLDAVLGDPEHMPHPVKGIGKLIELCERLTWSSAIDKKVAGIVLGIIIPAIVFFATAALIEAAGLVHAQLGTAVSVFIIYTCLSTRSLGQEAQAVRERIAADDLSGARQRVARIVGRDTQELNKPEIVRASIESVSENTVDGVISPLLYAFLGGAPLAMAYKAISTLDSMVGYRNERYREFGWFSARLDDVLNFVPARLCLVLIPIAAALLSPGRALKTLRIMLCDGRKSPSPNSGFPEAGFAAALAIQLGGTSRYRGVVHEKPLLGEREKELEESDIDRSIQLLWITSGVTLILFSCIYSINYF